VVQNIHASLRSLLLKEKDAVISSHQLKQFITDQISLLIRPICQC